jgi:hypothetical protein
MLSPEDVPLLQVSCGIRTVRFDCQKSGEGVGGKADVWKDAQAIERVFTEEEEAGEEQRNEINVNNLFTSVLHMTIVDGYAEFCTIQALSFQGIKLDIFQTL